MTEAPFLLLPYAVELSSVYYNCIISINHDRGECQEKQEDMREKDQVEILGGQSHVYWF